EIPAVSTETESSPVAVGCQEDATRIRYRVCNVNAAGKGVNHLPPIWTKGQAKYARRRSIRVDALRRLCVPHIQSRHQRGRAQGARIGNVTTIGSQPGENHTPAQ